MVLAAAKAMLLSLLRLPTAQSHVYKLSISCPTLSDDVKGKVARRRLSGEVTDSLPYKIKSVFHFGIRDHHILLHLFLSYSLRYIKLFDGFEAK